MAKIPFRNLFRGAKPSSRRSELEQTTRSFLSGPQQQQLFPEPAPIPEAGSPALTSEPVPTVPESPKAAAAAPSAAWLAPTDERSVGEYASEAVQLRDAGRVKEAEALLSEAIERFPAEPRPRIEWALLAHARRDWLEAVRRWELVRAQFPDEAAAYAFGAAGLRELDRYEEAETLLDAGRECFPDNIGIACENAWLATHRRVWAEALRRWGLVRKQFPDRAIGYIGVALIQRELRWFDEAEGTLTDAIELFPTEAGPHVEYARLADIHEHWAEAAARWETVRERFPDHPAGYASGASAYRELGRLDEAEALLGEAVQRLPNHTGVAIDHAAAAHRRRDWAETVRRCETLRTASPLQPIGHTLAGAALRELGRFDEAEPLLASACARFPADLGAATEYAHLAVARRDWAQAVERWEEVCRRDPNQLGAQLQQAVALRELGRHDDAEALLRQSATKHPDSPHPQVELARVAEARQDWEEALARWRHLRSDESVSYIGEAAVLRRVGRAEEAEPLLLKPPRGCPMTRRRSATGH
jgi:tetratricopeptide (TPR) repeat protein